MALIVDTGKEEVDEVVYYWAQPDAPRRPEVPWDVIVNTSLDRINWSIKLFGIPGTYEKPGRWFMWRSRFYFYNEHDMAVFVLKWA